MLSNGMRGADDDLRLGWGMSPSSLPFGDEGERLRGTARVLCIQLCDFAMLQFDATIESAWFSSFSLLLLGSVRLPRLLVAACMSFRGSSAPPPSCQRPPLLLLGVSHYSLSASPEPPASPPPAVVITTPKRKTCLVSEKLLLLCLFCSVYIF